jgi:hypothetical protein
MLFLVVESKKKKEKIPRILMHFHGVNQSGGTFELSTPRDSAKYAGII